MFNLKVIGPLWTTLTDTMNGEDVVTHCVTLGLLTFKEFMIIRKSLDVNTALLEKIDGKGNDNFVKFKKALGTGAKSGSNNNMLRKIEEKEREVYGYLVSDHKMY